MRWGLGGSWSLRGAAREPAKLLLKVDLFLDQTNINESLILGRWAKRKLSKQHKYLLFLRTVKCITIIIAVLRFFAQIPQTEFLPK